MQLPPKSERSIWIDFSKEDKIEYDKLEKTALDFYKNFRATNHKSNLGKHYLKLTQKLTPMRVACAGGKIPLDDVALDEAVLDDADEEKSDQETQKKKGKTVKQYSEFVFKSKLNKLVEELKAARDKDPSCK